MSTLSSRLLGILLLLLVASPLFGEEAFQATNGGLVRKITTDTTDAFGLMLLRVERSAATMQYRMTVSGLTRTITASYFARRLGDTFEVLRPLDISGDGPTFTGTMTSMTQAELAMIDSGTATIILATANDPGGYLAGQIEVLPSALAVEFDPVSGTGTSGRGSAWIIVEQGTSNARYMVAWERLKGNVIDASFYAGSGGSGGGTLIRSIPLSGDTLNFGQWNLTNDEMNLLRSGRLYVEVRTDSFPNGEIRGVLAMLEFFGAAIEPSNVVPPISGSMLTGTGYAYVLTIDGFAPRFNVRSVVAGADVTSAHVHRGGIGETGTMFRELDSSSFRRGEWDREDDNTVSADDYQLLRAGGMYLDYHTTAYPEGAARGQLIPNASNLTNPSLSVHPESAERMIPFNGSFDRSTNVIRFTFSSPVRGAQVMIYNTMGELVASTSVDGVEGAIDGGGLPRGVYIAQLVVDGRMAGKCMIAR